MKTAQNQVREFMVKACQATPAKPCIPDLEIIDLRTELISEEFGELIDALYADDLVGVADGLADLLVVVLGTAVSCGIDIQPIWDEVMRSNMTKFIDGHKRADGKWVKGPSYSPASLKPIIEAQLCNSKNQK